MGEEANAAAGVIPEPAPPIILALEEFDRALLLLTGLVDMDSRDRRCMSTSSLICRKLGGSESAVIEEEKSER